MAKVASKLFNVKPASYPSTSTTEQYVKDIFHALLDRTYIMGEVRTLDKFPNTDGILELTDIDHFPIGKIDVQLKTLQSKNYKFPRYQIDKGLLAYCDNSQLPVILIAINKEDKLAYWKYFDRKTLIELSKKIKGNSVSVRIPIENCISEKCRGYVQDWMNIVLDSVQKINNYDEVLDRNEELSRVIKVIQSKLEDPTDLPLQIVKELHEYIDIYNYILDREFRFVKKYLYPDCWKIGIGIFEYDIDGIRYLLYPVEFKKEQTLVKKVKRDDYHDIFQEMLSGNILSITSNSRIDEIAKTPWLYAYNQLEKTILETIDKYTYAIPDEFSANEYLTSFIDKFSVYLDFDLSLDYYSIKDLKHKLFSVLPMVEAENKYYADWVVEYTHSIDHQSKVASQEVHRKNITDAIQKISSGYTPKVNVTLDCQLYSFKVIKFYIAFLEELGYNKISRVYLESNNSKIKKLYPWQKWDRETLFHNHKLLLQNFKRVYDKCLDEYFYHIKSYLRYLNSYDYTLVHLLNYEEGNELKNRPYQEIYHLRPFISEYSKEYYFLNGDSGIPIDREQFFLHDNRNVEIEDKKYYVTMMQARPLDFMFKVSPMNELIKIVIKDKLHNFFKERKSKESRIQID